MAKSSSTRRKGTLVIAGTGIMAAAHTSLEAVNAIKHADRVFVAIPDPLGLNWLHTLNDNVESLDDLYESCDNRLATYHAMVDRILDAVRNNEHVCAVFYGHPGVFVLPSHLALEQARQEGYDAVMLPGISAADCLFSDLNVDPSHPGCQMYEASAFLFWTYQYSPHAALVLWQIGVVGDHTFARRTPAQSGLATLVSRLLENYPADHPVCIYEASRSPLQAPRTDWLVLGELVDADVTGYSTLYIPPYRQAPVDNTSLSMLGLTAKSLANID